jgi:inosose dehydratase
MTGPVRIAGAPISWGVCEAPGWGHQMAAGRVLSEMRALGLRATEAGPDGFLPAEPDAARSMLAAHGLALVGGFVPLVLHRGTGWHGELRRVAGYLAACGGEVAVLAAVAGHDGYDSRPPLSSAEWRTLLGALDEAAGLAAGLGLRAVLHPHVGTVVQRPAEIDRVLAGTQIPLCLDTGHIRAGGGDPAALARQAAGRVGHVHLKDVRAGHADRVATGRMPYAAAVRGGLYCPLGQGDARITAVLQSLRAAGYGGWYVLEQDLMLDAEPPAGGGPREQAAGSLRFLRDVLAGAP